MNRITRLRRLAIALGVVGTLAVPAAASAQTVPVQISGSHCHAFGKLAFWRLTVDNQVTTGNIYGTSTTVNVAGGSRQFIAQAWCRYGFSVGIGRWGAANRWVYSSGYQPTVTIRLV